MALRTLIVWSAYVCWAAFLIVWIAGAIYNLIHSPKLERRRRSGPLLVLIALGLWLVARFSPASWWSPISVREPAVESAGCLILVLGTAFAIWARLVLGTMWSFLPAQRADHELRMEGPYAITRHPIYTGILAMLLGTALVNGLGLRAIVFCIAAIALVIKLRSEEQLLLGTFGSQYEIYRRRVPGLIPWPRKE